MTNIYRLEQKVENEKLIYSLDKYSDYGVLTCSDGFEFKGLKEEFKEKYNLKDILIYNEKTNERSFDSIPDEIEVVENDLKFLVNLKNNFPGLPIDKKNARELVRDYSHNKDVLDLFANYGGFSVYASLEASSVTSVDSLQSNLDYLEKNVALNKASLKAIPQVWKQSYDEFINVAMETNTKFDLIILDLSSYNITHANSLHFDLQKEHLNLIKHIQDRLLRPSGFIFFITDVPDFVLDKYIRPGADKLNKVTIGKEFLPLRPHQSFAFYN